jgi:hypothetical protein
MYPASLKNIIIENNFIDKKEIDTLLYLLKNSSDKNELLPNGEGCDYRKDGSPVSIKTISLNSIGNPSLDSLIQKSKKNIEYNFGQRFYLQTPVWARVWDVGDFQSPHSDSEYNDSNLAIDEGLPEDEWVNHIPRFLSDYSSLFYLNDDYDGGELFFPEFNLTIKPRLGDLITFPTNSMYIHAVKEIKYGTRYNILLKWFRKTTLIANTIPKNNAISEAVKGFQE